jgi:hypothetical protein
MGRVRVKGRIATTNIVGKYPDWEIPPSVLEAMAEELRKGRLPLLFDHDLTQRLDGRVVEAQVVDTDDGHRAVEVELDVDAETWESVDARFKEAGVLGGFSYRATAIQEPSPSRLPASVVIAADAAAWSDDDRKEAASLIEAAAPTDAAYLFEFSAIEIATILLVLEGIGIGVLGNGAYDAIKKLVSKRQQVAPTRIEVHERRADGSEQKAVLITSDPELAAEALKQLAEIRRPAKVLTFDQNERLWLDHELGEPQRPAVTSPDDATG